jgi:BirA family biotin operon repressor/biotin-[acetyl-CoA-carboxylase] ligase
VVLLPADQNGTAGRQPFDAAAVPADGMWHTIEAVARTGSTNEDLLGRARRGAGEGLVMVADQQTAGRGRMGRSWVSPPRAALTFSFLLRPRVQAGRQSWIPLLAGVAVAAAVDGVTGVRARLKWPNDVLVPDGKLADGRLDWRKLAGILAESTGDAVVVGIGLNVSAQRDELPPPGPGGLAATSLLAAGSSLPVNRGEASPRTPLVNRERLLTGILLSFERRYQAWQHARGNPAELRAEYKSLCETLNRPVRVEQPGGQVLSGDAIDVDTDGRLVVLVSAAGAVKAGRALVPVSAGDVVHVRLSAKIWVWVVTMCSPRMSSRSCSFTRTGRRWSGRCCWRWS